MIRTAKNMLLGPFPKEEVAKKVSSGELELQDEVCPASGYWFYLHEVEEVQKFLGVVPPMKRTSDSDLTQTETHADVDQTDPDLEKERTPRPSEAVRRPEKTDTYPSYDDPVPGYPWAAIGLVILVAMGGLVLVWVRYFRAI